MILNFSMETNIDENLVGNAVSLKINGLRGIYMEKKVFYCWEVGDTGL